MYRNPDVMTDYSWRSLHISTVIGKQLTNLFYKRPHSKAYFIGCSLGGRQGINAADMFPGDFDGIVAGSPALDFNNLQSWRASFFPITGSNTSSNFISTSTWINLIHKEVLNQCDHLDGVIDSIIEDPSICHFRPETLLCTQSHPTNCLTAKQVTIVRKVFGPLYGEHDDLIYPAMQPGSEIKAAAQLYAGTPFSYSNEWFKYVIYDPLWNASTFNLHDAAVADDRNPANIRTWPCTLSSFKTRGGKVISYHGLQDEKITSFNTQRFYEHLLQGMEASSQDLDAFFRFFRVPGMFHCQTGPGAWVFGQGGGAATEGIGFNPSHNVLAAMVRWVEEGVAPEDIVGTKLVGDNVGNGVEFRKRHC
ncbi:MAG: hypothetical protein Q9228_007302, partial [Teloschistes exilis]